MQSTRSVESGGKPGRPAADDYDVVLSGVAFVVSFGGHCQDRAFSNERLRSLFGRKPIS